KSPDRAHASHAHRQADYRHPRWRPTHHPTPPPTHHAATRATQLHALPLSAATPKTAVSAAHPNRQTSRSTRHATVHHSPASPAQQTNKARPPVHSPTSCETHTPTPR